MLASLFLSDSRAEIMKLLFSGTWEEFYLREIEKLCSVQVSSIQKEVKHLTQLDLITARRDGNRIYYRANKEHPIYLDLVSIIEKTVGVVALLRERLIDPKIKCVFIFGSFAQNKEKATSDIDIIIIGDIGMRSITKLLSGLQEKFGREINPHIYSEDEFKKRVNQNDHFIASVLKKDFKVVLGDVNEYR
jgi:predicted nucleotidyltransferase